MGKHLGCLQTEVNVPVFNEQGSKVDHIVS
jgi:hypothetical protein